MTEHEIEHVAKAIYLVRVAPRRFPKDWNESSVEVRRSFEKDAIAAITALDALRGTGMNALAHASRIIVCRVSSGLEAILGTDVVSLVLAVLYDRKERIELEESGWILRSRSRHAP